MTGRSKGAVLLARLGKTQAQLAAELGASTGIVAMWLGGKRTPGKANREAMRARYGVPGESWDEEPDSDAAPARRRGRPPAPASADRFRIFNDGPTAERIARLEAIVDRNLGQLDEDATMTPLERAKVAADLARTVGSIRRLKGLDAVTYRRFLDSPMFETVRTTFAEVLRETCDRIGGAAGTDLRTHFARELERRLSALAEEDARERGAA